jgi:hypothetical protein
MIKNNTCGNRDAHTKRPGVKQKPKEKKGQQRINKVGHEESFVPIKWNRVSVANLLHLCCTSVAPQ